MISMARMETSSPGPAGLHQVSTLASSVAIDAVVGPRQPGFQAEESGLHANTNAAHIGTQMVSVLGFSVPMASKLGWVAGETIPSLDDLFGMEG